MLEKFYFLIIFLSTLQVSRLGLGCAGLSGIYNAPVSHEDGCSVIKEAFNRGITFFDTADVNGEKHDNEIMVGKVQFIISSSRVQINLPSYDFYIEQ